MKITGPDSDKLIPQEAQPLKGKEVRGKGHRASDAKRPAVKSADKVEISARAKEVSMAKEAASKAPDIRLSKVEAIKKALEDGSYRIDTSKVAEKILKEDLNL